MIIYKKLSDNRRIELQNKLANSNNLLDFYHSNLVQKITKFELFKEICNFKKSNPEDDFEKYNIKIPFCDINKITYVKTIELEILQSLVGIIYKININNKNQEDLFSESCKAVLKAMPYYIRPDIKFSTYFYNCIKNHLKCYFRKIKNNECDLYQEMILDKNHVYSGNRNHYPMIKLVRKNYDDEIIEKINKIDFSKLEKCVLEGFLDSKNKLGINSLAKKLINPKTNKPYTRSAISDAWKSVKSKIKKLAA